MAVALTTTAGNTISVSVSDGTYTTISASSTTVSLTPPATQSIEVKSQGPKGDTGETGPQGLAGTDGQGLIAGGSENQFIQKNSATDYDTKWSAYILPAADGLSLIHI